MQFHFTKVCQSKLPINHKYLQKNNKKNKKIVDHSNKKMINGIKNEIKYKKYTKNSILTKNLEKKVILWTNCPLVLNTNF